eukprot:12398974-Alexandrium_andersonii.AAC.1
MGLAEQHRKRGLQGHSHRPVGLAEATRDVPRHGREASTSASAQAAASTPRGNATGEPKAA